jgi:hypothetical protein
MSEAVDYTKVMTPEFAFAMGQGIASVMKQMPTNPFAMKAAAGNFSTNNLVHGTGSLFGGVAVGIDREVISAMMHWTGLTEYIPKLGVRTMELLLPFITGVEATSATEAQYECDDCIAGESEACIQHFPTGRVCRETQTMTPDRIIERLNTGDIDLVLLNDYLGNDSPWHPGDSFGSMTGENLMQIATAWALLFELPPLFMQALAPMTYTGNPVNNIANGYREFRGLDLLINTGFVDAFTNVTCPALDSDIKNFAYQNVVTATAPTFHEILEMAAAFVMRNATAQRLTPVEWAVVMRPELWQIYSGLIPTQAVMAALMGQMAILPARMQIQLNGSEIVAERDRLRQAMQLPLNGRMYRVILDDGIDEINDNNDVDDALIPGQFASDVYLIPMTYLGNRPAVRLEYKDFRYITPEIRATDGLIGDFYKPSGDGRFLWTWVKNGWCFKIQAKIEPRIILRTPQLAARITNVMYQPQQHMRVPDMDSPYFAKGGVSTRTSTTYYY